MIKDKSILLEAKEVLLQLIAVVNGLTFDEYTHKIELLGNSSIGEHTRHIIELFQQLENGYAAGIIDYDGRKRNIRIQQEPDYAIDSMANIIADLEKPDKPLMLTTLYNNQDSSIRSNYFRELIYNIEHCIHHQAIIKIGLNFINSAVACEQFGVAKSTLIYREKCAQ
jgi:hypothetical protein